MKIERRTCNRVVSLTPCLSGIKASKLVTDDIYDSTSSRDI